jgi:hypothetical protein
MRMGTRRFHSTHKRISNKVKNHGHMVALYFIHDNFCGIHKTLRVSPAMEAGITNRVWTIDELLRLA